MERRDAPILGRKVFFLNPPLSITTHVLDALKEQQYEVYCINHYNEAKPILRLTKDALCLIFIDDQLTLNEWYNFIKSFEYEEELKSIFLGVISARIRNTDKEKFLMNLKLPGGFIPLGGPVSEVFTTIKGILDVNGAMGKRKYLRLDCRGNDKIDGYFAHSLRLYQFNIDYLSTAGFTFRMNKAGIFKFQKNMILSNICINIGRRTVTGEGFVYETRIIDGEEIIIVLFTKSTDSSTKTAIRNFIYSTLQEKMQILIDNTNPDMENYSKAPDSKDASEKLDSIEANEVLNKIDEVEEIKEGDEKENEASEKADEKTVEKTDEKVEASEVKDGSSEKN